jgi:predicted ATPase
MEAIIFILAMFFVARAVWMVDQKAERNKESQQHLQESINHLIKAMKQSDQVFVKHRELIKELEKHKVINETSFEDVATGFKDVRECLESLQKTTQALSSHIQSLDERV